MILFNLTFNENVRKKKKLIDQHLQNLFNTFKILLIIVNGWKPLTIITKRSILDVAAALDPPLGFIKQHLICSLAFLVLS